MMKSLLDLWCSDGIFVAVAGHDIKPRFEVLQFGVLPMLDHARRNLAASFSELFSRDRLHGRNEDLPQTFLNFEDRGIAATLQGRSRVRVIIDVRHLSFFVLVNFVLSR